VTALETLHLEEDLIAIQAEIEERREALWRLLERPAIPTAEHRRRQSIQLALDELARLERLHAQLSADRPPGSRS
jgi:hypothetical protein